MSKLLRSLTAMLSILALAACAQLPRSSEIKVGPETKGDLSSDYLYYSPPGPSTGETQQDVLNGFINAGTGPQNDYASAREYLTQDYKTKWNPNKEVLIQQGNPAISFSTKLVATVNLQVQASVDADGHFHAQPAGATRSLSFEMVRENGEWRISKAPDLTILIRPVFDVIFRSYSVYFLDAAEKHLVPDLRWFPSRASTATRIMNAMLSGPSDWLKNAVVSAIPAGTALSLNSVTVAEGIASVDLTAKALTAKPMQRRLMKAQIRATLTQLPNVYSVSISVERGAQEIADLTDLVPSAGSTQALVLKSNEIMAIGDTGLDSLGGTSDLVKKLGATDFAMTASNDWMALKTASGIYRAHIGLFGTDATLVDSRPGQLAPSFDAQGYLWTMTKKAGDAVQITSIDGTRRNLKIGWLDAFPRRQFAISAEGSRITFLVGSGASVHVYVSSIVRDSKGAPLSFGAPLEVVGAASLPVSVAWADENALSVLTNLSDGSTLASTYTIGGDSSDLATISYGRSLEVRNGSALVYALDANHNLFQYRNLNWVPISTGVQSLHFAN
jgi:hypothetical protein